MSKRFYAEKQPQLEICPIYGGMCGYPSNLCYECPRHKGVKEVQSAQPTQDCISRQAAVNALWKALFDYEGKTEKQFIEADDFDVGDWIVHRGFVQNMSDIDRQTILGLPSAQPEETHEKRTETHGVCLDTWKADFKGFVDSLDMPRDDYKGIMEYIDEVPTAQPEQRWMPVTEGTPKESFPCFVTVGCTNSWGEEYPDILPYFVAYDRESEAWVDYDGDPCPFEIKAWMPLPKPYKGDQG